MASSNWQTFLFHSFIGKLLDMPNCRVPSHQWNSLNWYQAILCRELHSNADDGITAVSTVIPR